MDIERATIEQQIADATTVRNAAHRAYMDALNARVDALPAYGRLRCANQILLARKAERIRIITGAQPKPEESAAPEEPRTPDAQTFDLGHWELMHLCRILDAAIADDTAKGLSGECAKRLRQMVTTDGTVSITTRHKPE